MSDLKLSTSTIADVLDSYGCQSVLTSRLARSSGHGRVFCGIAYTVKWSPVRKGAAIRESQPSTWEQVRAFLVPELKQAAGKVYVAGAGPLVTEAALAGGLSTTYFEQLGFEGLVLGGAIRDADALRALEIPVVCSNLIPADTQGSYRVVETGTSCVIDNLVIHSGDWIVSDANGTVVVPAAIFGEVVEKAKQVEALEDQIITRIRRNERLPEIIDEVGRI